MEETDLFPCEDLPTPLCEALADRLPVISFAHDVRHNLYFECELQLSQMYAPSRGSVMSWLLNYWQL